MSAPAEFFVRLQKGIVGGFAPPTPDAVFTLTKPASAASLMVTTAVRPDGTPELKESAAPKELSITEPSTSSLVDELYTILKDLPTEQPPGSEDIYGLNTGIVFACDEFQWANGGPQGCTGGTSEVQPTEEQKQKFKRAVEIVHKIAEA
ncbi:hypothetical protein CC1G_12116 [Coprinopsis cinerea okayama7|uniref:Uncharacterized protein n=1 Tax=Coprinopsis cinerea (strain Okayama-7 / 130 / ATCC MYA-4618 / FGSC 9003) TaxID=240176 RepID=A8PHB9_COPC7|nr:hypothetical protein CC1G_12116 [Coprinopsis cinerea okayama7\|eukprot:XP_001841381.1 hypothetical protein CC1G_12116 [Coprinopsis cinerea okayama7\